MTEYLVTAYLRDDLSDVYGREPLDVSMERYPAEDAVNFTVEAADDLGACEVAYAICNSYGKATLPNGEVVDEMFAPERYRSTVEYYRAGRGHRSLSVGDIVVVGDSRRYLCASCGFKRVEEGVSV